MVSWGRLCSLLNVATDCLIAGPMLELIILLLTMQWLLSLFGQSIFPGVPHTASFIYILSVLIVLLIIMKFVS